MMIKLKKILFLFILLIHKTLYASIDISDAPYSLARQKACAARYCIDHFLDHTKKDCSSIIFSYLEYEDILCWLKQPLEKQCQHLFYQLTNLPMFHEILQKHSYANLGFSIPPHHSVLHTHFVLPEIKINMNNIRQFSLWEMHLHTKVWVQNPTNTFRAMTESCV